MHSYWFEALQLFNTRGPACEIAHGARSPAHSPAMLAALPACRLPCCGPWGRDRDVLNAPHGDWSFGRPGCHRHWLFIYIVKAEREKQNLPLFSCIRLALMYLKYKWILSFHSSTLVCVCMFLNSSYIINEVGNEQHYSLFWYPQLLNTVLDEYIKTHVYNDL